MATQERLLGKLEALFSDIPVDQIPEVMKNMGALLNVLDKAESSDVHELHTLSDIRAKELEQEVIGHQNKCNWYSLFGNVSGAALAAWLGFAQEPFECVRDFVSRAVMAGAKEIDPRYPTLFRGEFADNFNYNVDQISRLPTAVIAGVVGWLAIGYLARKLYNNTREVRSTRSQYASMMTLKACSEEIIGRRYGR